MSEKRPCALLGKATRRAVKDQLCLRAITELREGNHGLSERVANCPLTFGEGEGLSRFCCWRFGWLGAALGLPEGLQWLFWED